MPVTEEYKGLNVLVEEDPETPGKGGVYISNDFRSLVDWNPKSDWEATTWPSAGDDEVDHFQVGSRWFATEIGAFVCVDNAEAEARWIGIPFGTIALNASVETTNATATKLVLDGTDDVVGVEVRPNSTWAISAVVIARRVDDSGEPPDTSSGVWEIKRAVKRDEFGTALFGTLSTSSWLETGASSGGWTVSFVVSGNELSIQVQGTASQDVRWTANLRIVPLDVSA